MRVGILGSLVWDRIDHPDSPRVERWGGIAYSLAAAAAAAPAGWSLRPLIKVGRDLAREAEAFLATVPGLERAGGIRIVDAPNNRVHLEYHDRLHRSERLTGGVPGWEWAELEPGLNGLDALFINLISGYELELDVAERLRVRFDGPLYADLHSLLLGPPGAGPRQPRPLAGRDRWLAAFDLVQVNEAELALVAGDDPPWAVAENAVRAGLGALLVTRGPAGAAWLARQDGPLPRRREARVAPGPVLARGEVTAETAWPEGDPTGCGDVWGATCFMALLEGASLTAAMGAANRAASWNLAHRGADGLYRHLRARP